MPYAPTVDDRSGMIMAAGIKNAGGSITDAITRSQQDAKRLKALRAMAVDGMGMDPEQVDKMDEGTLQGHLESVAVRNVMSQMQQREQQSQFATEDQAFQREAADRALADQDYTLQQRQAAARFMQDPAFSGVGPSGPVEQQFNPQSIMGAASRAGMDMSPRDVAVMMNQQGSPQFFNRGEADKATPIAPGFLRAVLGPNNAQIIPDMSEAGAAVAIKGPGGEDLGFGLPGRSGVTPLKTGGVTDKDQFNALQAEKRALISAKGRSVRTDHPVYDSAIAKIDEQLAGLQEEKPKAADPNARIAVIGPDGRRGSIPAAQWKDAESKGYKKAP
jgi:hypothetical protein